MLRQRPNPVEGLTLAGLAQVALRLPEDAPLAYLAEKDVTDLLCADVYHYRARVEDNGAGRMPMPQTGRSEAGIELR